MPLFSYEIPPKTAGVYAHIHKPTQRMHFGHHWNLRLIYTLWIANFDTPMRIENYLLRELVRTSEINDWQFSSWVTPEGNQQESYLTIVKNAREKGVLVLNSEVDDDVRNKKSVVLNGAGRAMTNGEVAAALGITTQGVAMRLRYYREKGIFTHTLEDLKAGSQRYRKRAQMERMAAQIEAAEKEEAQTS